jgi:hypothetical protein
MDSMDAGTLDRMLHDLGDLLGARRHHYHVAVLGGTALLLHELVSRTTRDVDVLGLREDGQWLPLPELPGPLAEAVGDVARLHGEDEKWLNAKASALLAVGMPAGWEGRLSPMDFGLGLRVSLVGREDLVATKLYALTDQSPTSKHANDLLALGPSPDELAAAAAWCRRHDPSPAFAGQLEQVLAWLWERR